MNEELEAILLDWMNDRLTYEEALTKAYESGFLEGQSVGANSIQVDG